MKIPFYPKTNHLFGSKETNILSAKNKNFEHLNNKRIVIEEKVDGQAIGISFENGLLY